MKYLLLLSLAVSINGYADTELNVNDELALADEAIQSPTMTIEGQYKMEAPVAPKKAEPKRVVQKQLSSSDRLKLLRIRLEERNKIMIEKKMEQIRFQQELALARQLEQSMNKTIQAIDGLK